MLRKVSLELLGEQTLGHVVASAARALLQVRGQGLARRDTQVPAVLVEQGEARRRAVHGLVGHGA
jgi:hypothetical protein